MIQIVTAESTSTSNNNNNSDPGHLTNPDSSSSSTLGKIRQTLSTSLLTAQDKGLFFIASFFIMVTMIIFSIFQLQETTFPVKVFPLPLL